jgi:hypothetical protein
VAIFQMILFFMAGLMHSALTKATRRHAQKATPKEHERREKPEQNSGSNSAGALIGAKHAQRSRGGQA